MSETDVKPWYLSSTIWGSLVAAVVTIVGLFGGDTTAVQAETGNITNVIMGAIAVVGSAVAIIGRVKAKKTIGSVK